MMRTFIVCGLPGPRAHVWTTRVFPSHQTRVWNTMVLWGGAQGRVPLSCLRPSRPASKCSIGCVSSRRPQQRALALCCTPCDPVCGDRFLLVWPAGGWPWPFSLGFGALASGPLPIVALALHWPMEAFRSAALACGDLAWPVAASALRHCVIGFDAVLTSVALNEPLLCFSRRELGGKAAADEQRDGLSWAQGRVRKSYRNSSGGLGWGSLPPV